MSGVRGTKVVCVGVFLALVAATMLVGAAHGQGRKEPPVVRAKKPARPNAAPRQPGKSKAQERRDQQGYLVPDQRHYAGAKGLPEPTLRPSASTRGGPGPLVPSVNRGWDGEFDPLFTPMDSTGAIGPSRYVELVNSRFAIYDRSNDAALASGTLESILGTATSPLGDPQIIWDDATGRFYLLAVDFNNGLVHYGYSTTDTPSSASDFCPYTLDFGYGSEIPDYPKLGDTQNFLLVGVNVFTQFDEYDGSDALWISKPPAGASCASTPAIGGTSFLKTSTTPFTFTPVGVNQTDSSTTGWLVANNAWTVPGSSTFSGLVVFQATENGSGGVTIPQNGKQIGTPSAYSFPPNATQPGTPSRLDTLDTRFTQAVSAVDPTRGGATALWTQHTTAGGAGAIVRWYEVNPTAATILQSGVVSDGSRYVFNGAISPDRVVNGPTKAYGGSMVLGFNTSSTSSAPGIQMVAKPAGGTQSALVPVKTSSSAELCFSSVCRWGDYAAATPDPAADTTAATGVVWLTNEWTTGDQRTWNWAAGANTPGITSFTPITGPVGTLVTINGTAFTGATSVKFGTVDATFTVVSDTKITATVPSLAPASGSISVTTPLGTFVSATPFKVTPAITGVAPTSGQVGDTVVISGTSFTGATSVKFGAIADLTFSVDSDFQITAHVPAGALTAKITVATPGGTATSAVTFGVRPTITSFTPSSGPAGTQVTINGNTFNGTTKVTFGAPTATGALVSVTPTQIKANVPPSAVTGPITVTNAGGSTASTDAFTVLPKVTGFSPTAAVANTNVTITGTGLAGTTDVKFNGVSAAIVSASATAVVAKVPDSATTGTIAVTTPDGTATSTGVFKPLPKLTLVTPSPAQAGDSLTITGTNLTGATSLKLGATVVAFSVDSATQLTATLPASALTGGLTVTTPAGTSAALTLPVRPTITSFTPSSGPAGAQVTINGNTFSGTTKVTFGSPTATGGIASVTNTQLKVNVPSTAVTGPIMVTNAGGSTTSADTFTVLPKITGFSPTAGVANTNVTITGTGLAGTTDATFNGVSAAIVSATATTVVAKVPDSATVGKIAITTPDGTALSTGSFSPTPKLVSVSPTPPQAGDAITIAGTNLTGATALKLGGVSIPFGVDSAIQLSTTVPSTAVTGSLTVTTPAGTSAGLTLPVRPTVTSFTPSSGPAGTVVTISGNTLSGTTKIAVGSLTATGPITPVSNTQIKVTVPTSAVTGPITVTNAGGSTTSADTYTVLPKITGFSPTAGVANTNVTITGTGLGGATDVTFNGVSAAIVSTSATTVVAKVPDTATAGQIAVTTPAGTATSTGSFTPTPKLTSVLPSPAQAGDTVTIAGSNLTGATALKLGGASIPFSVDSATQLTATVPSTAVTAGLTVTTPAGTSAGLTLLVRPTITSFTPTSGQTGTTITINGNTFTGTTAVKFGASTTLAGIVSVTNTQLKVTVNGGALSGAITVTNAGGSTVSADSFSVLPKIGGFTPSSGAVGTLVTINGNGLTGATGVAFNGVPSTSVTPVSDRQVRATVPAGATTGLIQVTTPSGSTTSATPFTVTGSLTLPAPIQGPISERSYLGYLSEGRRRRRSGGESDDE